MPVTFDAVSTNPKKRSPGKPVPSLSTVPPRWRKDVERVLISDAQLARRIKTLAREIELDFKGRETVVVSLLNGTVLFLADLVRHLNLPLRRRVRSNSNASKGRSVTNNQCAPDLRAWAGSGRRPLCSSDPPRRPPAARLPSTQRRTVGPLADMSEFPPV